MEPTGEWGHYFDLWRQWVAAPNAEVTVTDGKGEIGKVKADSRGEWVLVPNKSLPAGPHELSLEAKGKKDKPKVLSRRKVILVVPERGKDIAGRKATKPSGPLVMAVPRDEAGATTVLQRLPRGHATKPWSSASWSQRRATARRQAPGRRPGFSAYRSVPAGRSKWRRVNRAAIHRPHRCRLTPSTMTSRAISR